MNSSHNLTAHSDTGAYVRSLMELDKTTLPADGGERFNRLIFARSPYLLQHAENRVNWYEWGEEAFKKAREENMPIFLSIGYATCHWCHVMAHESFEDKGVGDMMNRHYVAIKVDREERPDIDDFYMTVAQTMTGGGGWPLNVFMTPDKQPFMTITYLPPRGAAGRSGLTELLANIATLWRQRPDKIDNNCRAVMSSLAERQDSGGAIGLPDYTTISNRASSTLQKIHDPNHGGFGTSPKIPMPIYLGWLLDRERSEERELALLTLKKMRSGGIWDQLGGGLHRYSVDRQWLVPHFEKMLYDQAMLASVTVKAFLTIGDDSFRTMTEDIFTFCIRELRSPEGPFYSALDADSEGVEGKFYLWDKREVDDRLAADSELFCHFYGITAAGNFEEVNILTAPLTLDAFCQRNDLNRADTAHILNRARTTLLRRREERIRPLRDDKIITSWNGLMIGALATAGIIWPERGYQNIAAQAATFILEKVRRPDGRLLRSYLDGGADIPAFLEDYAFLASGILDLFEATLDPLWLTAAEEVTDDLLRLFRDPVSGRFTLIGSDAEQMPLRVSSDHDGVTPSAFGRTAQLLHRLAGSCDRPDLVEASRVALGELTEDLVQNPLGQLGALSLISCRENEPTIATFRGAVNSPEAGALNSLLHHHLIVNLSIRSEPSPSPLSLAICPPGCCLPEVSTPPDLEKLLVESGLSKRRST